MPLGLALVPSSASSTQYAALQRGTGRKATRLGAGETPSNGIEKGPPEGGRRKTK
jgi:hypothetical protein